MAFKIVITHKAQIDINEGIEWYDKQAHELQFYLFLCFIPKTFNTSSAFSLMSGEIFSR